MLLKLFYLLKPIIPRYVQIAMRRERARNIYKDQKLPFLCEDTLMKLPEAHDNHVKILLTHDVEGQDGLDRIQSIIEVENEFGFKSTWNFVLDKYGDVEKYVKGLNDAGHECGAHGLFHDGKLFRSPEGFRERMERIKATSDRLGIKGFRSPSLLRDISLLRTLDFDWDSSIPAWDPFQPQPGGCCCYSPFMLNRHTVEFPVTLWQDFTLFRELDELDARIWIAQAEKIASFYGLINIIVHPDYFSSEVRNSYRQFLQAVSDAGNTCVALPSQLAQHYRKIVNEKQILG